MASQLCNIKDYNELLLTVGVSRISIHYRTKVDIVLCASYNSNSRTV